LSEKTEKVIIYIDGGSRGNPGPSAAAFYITDLEGKMLSGKGVFLGRNTNNFAEYSGMLSALHAAKQLGAKKIDIFSDSQLMVRQILGTYKVKSDNIKDLYQQVMAMLAEFNSWNVQHVLREKNKQADKLVNQALDAGHDIELTNSAYQTNSKPVRLGVLISGGGTTLLNIQKLIEQGDLNAKVAVVISSLSNVAGVERAKKAGFDVKIIRKKDHPDIAQFSKKIEDQLTAANVDLVIQAGWLCLWKIPEKYKNRVMNIHPALLPSFGGKGMWGHHVHQAVLDAGCKVSGCTVHFCSDDYDSGPIIIQRTCPVAEDDTTDTLAARVFQQECIAYPQAIRLFAQGKLIVKNGKVKIK
jgi:phosphoribosylglycinamide formyltransferase 1